MICDKEKCTGCFACFNACPKNAIIMEEDSNGFIYPEIDKNECIECKLCEKVCPSINKVEYYKNQKCYAMYSKDQNIRFNSTSGGIATTLSKNVINNEGIVYGASYIENCSVQHIRATELETLTRLQGSKYVHSYINNIYKKVKEDLTRTDKEVLFIGTPCQIAGLKKYLVKEHNNLILMDIICHGVPSQKYLKDEVNRINKSIDIDRVNFRDENKYGFFIINNKQVTYGVERDKSPYCDAFMKTLSLRENCYNCDYAGSSRISDITIGDFWGLSKESRFYDNKDMGVSTVIVSTEKGQKFLEKYMKDFYIEEREYEESVNGNAQLRNPALKNKNADKFKSDYIKYGFEKAYRNNTKVDRIKRKLRKIKNILKNRS